MSQQESFDHTHFIALGGTQRTLKPGELIGDTYRLKALLGQGGMGYVFLAEHLLIGKDFALKIIRPDKLDDISRLRFEKEARVIAKLEHPNIIKIYNMGLDQGDCPYFVMDLLQGKSLSDYIDQEHDFTPDQYISIFTQVAQGLGYAHARGIVHRDIKPTNIVITEVNGGYKPQIVDFGIAKVVETQAFSGQSLTTTGLIFGSPYYMSPEQCMGRKVDARSDIYSLGCTLYEALTTLPPFRGKTAMETMTMHVESPTPCIPHISSDPALSQSLNEIIAKMTAKAPEMRYQSMEQLVHDFERVKAGKSISKSGISMLDPQRQDQQRLNQQSKNQQNKDKQKLPHQKHSGQNSQEQTLFDDQDLNSPEQSATASGLSRSMVRSLAIAGTVVFVLAGTAFAILNKSAPPQALQTSTSPGSQLPASRAVAELHQKINQFGPFTSTIVTDHGRKKLLFHFPDAPVGTIGNTLSRRPAAGDVLLDDDSPPQFGIYQKLMPDAFECTEITSKFAPDTLNGLYFESGINSADALTMSISSGEHQALASQTLKKHLLPATRWTNLSYLSLSQFKLDQETIDLIKSIKPLLSLHLKHCDFACKDFVHSGLLSRLNCLMIDEPAQSPMDDILIELGKSKSINILFLSRLEVLPRPIAALRECKSLKLLKIFSGDFAPGAIKALMTLKNVKIELRQKTDYQPDELAAINVAARKDVVIFDYAPDKIALLKRQYPAINFDTPTGPIKPGDEFK